MLKATLLGMVLVTGMLVLGACGNTLVGIGTDIVDMGKSMSESEVKKAPKKEPVAQSVVPMKGST